MLVQLLFSDPLLFLIVVVSILLALGIHEYSHAQMAYSLGDPTAKNQGRLTINPFAHLDPVGTLLLFFIGIGWGKPVPFNPYNLKNRRRGELLVALAGPGSNFVVALIVGLFLRFFVITNFGLLFFLSFFVWINLILGVFNLMPIPPLDGSHILFSFPRLEKFKTIFLKNSLLLIFAVILFMSFVGFQFIVGPLYVLFTGTQPPF
ncbi:site-2 protease family protein [Patescibacteria group bacterium]|nr:site-2 protease family protein [Patescibacteria group bacterium]MBU4274946.1 site-2 protease family protein [Patescibacteria group bacterium]MBU4367872.1 site-2 protease family protein [Patescibacteria group bacterium]MBU4461951.1 site-2 protease family protein [Patescibacteria group bacterium]MCG2699894.1 site-2 protease family protein [Candidatus Parcubacteria bacterium]